ncbi:hypothetical protein GTG28_06510 [Vibrio sp. OCN044]|uniref:Uncharacterized protein n=1 Tax=Vibrio tetraodonis subsp. pristinus TaxID=2695891 RepID=A0A6L8LS14_9VIBR|nr:hypothetical protein [Vibrio tetraodonis]MYM58871.1 hypothetical protein [Vibrio tetraodonis subsp. pristinus]
MRIEDLLESDLLNINQDFNDLFIEMQFLLESGNKGILLVSNEQANPITARFHGLNLSANKTTSNDIPTLGEVEGVSFSGNVFTLEGDFGFIEIKGNQILLRDTL